MEPCPSHSTFPVQTQLLLSQQRPQRGGHGFRKDTGPRVLPKGQFH